MPLSCWSARALGLLLSSAASLAVAQVDSSRLKVSRFVDEKTVELTSGRRASFVTRGERLGAWTLMEVIRAELPWLADGERIAVSDAVTRWGRVDFSIVSSVRRKSIAAQIHFPDAGLAAETRLRLRAPNERRIRSVTLNGRHWTQFDSNAEIIVIPARTAGTVAINVRY
jgi:hypothetical protein